jgi:hypothetical protein
MLRIFRNNGIRFYPVDALLQPIGTRFLELPFALQNIPFQAKQTCKKGCAVWFDDLIKIQVVSSEASVSFNLRNAAGATLLAGNFVNRGAFDGATLFWVTINLAAVAGINNGSTLLIQAGTERYLSEPLYNEPQTTIKIQYSNYLDNYDYGSFRSCEEMVTYVRAELVQNLLPQNKITYEDARGQFKNIAHSWHDGRQLQTQSLNWYEIQILQAALMHDKIRITERPGLYSVVSDYEVWGEEMPQISKQIENYQGYVLSVPLVEKQTYGRRLAGSDNTLLALLVSLLPETNVGATAFTANWQALLGIDFYEVQISTDPNFTTIVQSATGITNNSFTFSGLTSCTKYYYRVRASSCGVFSPWSSNVSQQRQTIHLRGVFQKAVANFDEKIIGLQVNNLLGLASNIQYKLLSGTLTNPNDAAWDLQPFLTLTQLQNNIDLQAGPYSVLFIVTGFAFGTEAVLELAYNTASFWLRVGCTTYNFQSGISQDLLIGGSRRMQIDSITLTNSATVLGYELILSNTQSPVLFATNLAALNSAIAALLPTQQYIIGIYVSNSNTIATINISYL